ncbi:hypothetical protein FBUS_06601 [Fasciolopsis buskii]|uniref:Uncharacterized protein n=1 Tax=Fasciolopsis buskii TaxID=27845 RepID=A0A8E0RQC7_9TREM|nr:hypothetical protein FBUS_06601 [Fasciolopsis buski]
MGRHLYETIILGCAIGLIVFSLILTEWRCGSLFKHCMDRWKEVSLAVIILFCVGLACLALALLLDLIQCCSGWLDTNPGYLIMRLCFLCLGAVLALTALLTYTVQIQPDWSYLASVSGVAFAAQIAFLSLITCQCCGVSFGNVVVS